MQSVNKSVVSFIFAVFAIGFFSHSAQAGLITNVDVTGTNEISVTINGTIDGPSPVSNATWLFIVPDQSISPWSGTECPSTTGDLVGLNYACVVNNAFFGGTHIELNFGGSLSVGTALSGIGVFSLANAHGKTSADFDGASVYWGNSNVGVFGGTFQGVVNRATDVPEPSILALFAIAGLGLIRRKKA